MRQILTLILFIGCLKVSIAQKQITDEKKTVYVDFAGTVGNSQGSVAGSYVYNWKLGAGKVKKWELGVGARLTSTFGKKLEYTTAGPAKFTRTNKVPFLIVFAGQNPENWDTLYVQRPFVNALNLTANFGYHFTQKISLGFNIDLIGFSVGRKSAAVYTSDGKTSTEPATIPTSFNILLTGDHDIGTLNSEVFLKYRLSQKWALRAVYQFLFNEYTTTNIKQTLPDGSTNIRFRNKSNNFGMAISYQLK